MIRQDFFGGVQNVRSSLVLISIESLREMLGYNNFELPDDPDEIEALTEKYTEEMDVLIRKIMDGGGDIIGMDISSEAGDLQVVKKHTVDNDGKNQAVLEIRPGKLKMTRFLMKGELTSVEYFKKRIKQLGLPLDELSENDFALRDGIINEYKLIMQS